ncbi:hypothetical protein A3A60_01805 [Candidatus Curtissbacteria bacterium RIFCSPLOWO2_01_FULL_42_26]|uniref:DDH domain-containing protein n=1 Tax=Candidatus Curtissbacteria bacterium RIFCSPLOWO2_01_FULL_42_26 TaxID=1797729 RepID=A0A1F5I1F8_9BACT|nr:MAG: hypothetical protein A3A60_01805 [Candidatus Curtissbacteria bacterium RIFCSPLOWO2_01_FULL_42_26]
MDDYLKEETQKNLARAQSILVAIAKEAGFDALASGLALFLCLKKLRKNVSIIGQDPSVSDAQKLYAVDKIRKRESNNNLVITVNNAIDKVDKVTHFLDGKTLKLVIHALAGSEGAQKEDIGFEYSSVYPDFIFAIGYESMDQLRKEFAHEQDISSDVWIVSINKDKMSQQFAQVNLTDPSGSSISEITTTAIKTLSLPIDEDIAFNLYSGLSQATRMFTPSLTTPATLETAQYLIKFGAGKASLANINIEPKFSGAAPRPAGLSQNPWGPTKRSGIPSAVFSTQKRTDYAQFLNKSETQKPIEETEREESKESWLKPPKIYRGSKSFDSES